MNSVNNNSDHLFEGILESAQHEAQRKLAGFEEQVATLQQNYAKKIEQTIEHEQSVTTKRLEQIKRNEESTLRNIERRHTVSYTQRLRTTILELVGQKMERLIETKEYRSILIKWIGEATVGLNLDEAIVNYSFKESVDESMLKEAEQLVKKNIGRDVKLTLGNNNLTSQGIEVTSLDKKIAYNNQVATRLLRSERQLKEFMEGQV
jgi:vacuolar-type H+-ATPase subunit E/Vma4